MTSRVLVLALLLALPVSAQEARDDPAGMLGTTDGAEIYKQICQGCHMPDGQGAEGAGRYPAFAGSTTLASADFVALTILQGRRNMPSFDIETAPSLFFPPTWLSDEQVANVTNYLRTSFGNAYEGRITAADVRKLRPPKKEAKP